MPRNINCFKDFEKGLAYAKEQGKPILLDFTGRLRQLPPDGGGRGREGVLDLISEKYVISLYVDDREQLETPYKSPFSGQHVRSVGSGNKWADFQAIHFSRNSQPYYVLLSNSSLVILNEPRAYTPDKEEYQSFLECGLDRF